MSIWALIVLLLTHGIFDFLLQDRETAKKKSSSIHHLGGHLFTIYVGLSLYALISNEYTHIQGFSFAVLNTILHGVIDWNIWKGYKYSVIKRFPNATSDYPYQDDSWFYNFIMLDQVLHGLCYLGIHVLVKGLL